MRDDNRDMTLTNARAACAALLFMAWKYAAEQDRPSLPDYVIARIEAGWDGDARVWLITTESGLSIIITAAQLAAYIAHNHLRETIEAQVFNMIQTRKHGE